MAKKRYEIMKEANFSSFTTNHEISFSDKKRKRKIAISRQMLFCINWKEIINKLMTKNGAYK
jgi:hypothetical protein